MPEIGDLQAHLQRLLNKRNELGQQRELLTQRGAIVDSLTESLNQEHDRLKEDEKANTADLRDIRQKLKELERDMTQDHRDEAKEFAGQAGDILRALDEVVPLPAKKK